MTAIAIQRELSLAEYREINTLVLRHSTRGRRVGYWAWQRVLPILGVCAIPAVLAAMVMTWRAADGASALGLLTALLAYSGLLAAIPLLMRRRTGSLYAAQELDRVWLIEISEAGIRSQLTGRFDSMLDWRYFDMAIETDALMVLTKRKQLVFVSLPKREMSAAEIDALRAMIVERMALKRV